jgi:tetratricopeptide (TPR) repeat protein
MIPVPVQLPTLCIFVSSTWHDLRPERSIAVEALNRLRSMKFVGMDYSGPWNEPPLYPSLKEARECDAYVGIFGGRYGSGITAQEYRAARSERKPCFIYLKDESSGALEADAEQDKRERLQALKAELLIQHTCEVFTTTEDLAAKITADLSNWYARQFLPAWAEDFGRRRVPGFAPFQLPRPLPLKEFFGRRSEIDTLLKALEPSEEVGVGAISGMGGVGKTALAILVAEKLRDDYPHAQLFVELRSMRSQPLDLADALKRCLISLGAEIKGLPDDVTELSKIYRHNLSGKRALVVLDDVADESQLQALMPPRGCALLVTSREKLFIRGNEPIDLNPLDALEARAMLMKIASRIEARDADQIAILCGHLPLALCAAGSLISVTADLAPSDYARQLYDEQTRLEALDRKAARMLGISVEATFNISYERLEPEAKFIFRCLAVFPTTFDKEAQEAVCGVSSGQHLGDLVRLSLVFFDERLSRYRLHDLVRIFTTQLLPADERETGIQRHAGHFLDVARSIEALHERESTANQGLELFDTEWENLQAGRAWAAKHSEGDAEAALSCLHYADALKHLLYLRRPPREQIKWIESALVASRGLKQRVTEGRYLCQLGTAYSMTEPRRAIQYFREAIGISDETEDPLGRGNALGGLGNIYASLGEDETAIDCYKECLLELYELSDGRDAGRTLTNLGNIFANRRQSRHAVEFYRQALKVAIEIEIGDRRGEAVALCNLADEEARCGENRAAVEYYTQALLLMRETGDLRGQAAVLTGLGNAHGEQSEHTQAFKCYQEALQIVREVGDLNGEGVALGGMGNAYVALHQFDEGIRHHKQALDISRELGLLPSEVQDLTNLGNAYYQSGDNQTALEFHRQALSISRETRQVLYEGIALWNIAQVFGKANEKVEAQIHAAGAFEILDQLRHPLAEDIRKFLY